MKLTDLVFLKQDPHASKDINDDDNDPSPRYDPSNENKHGTRCAGVVAAAMGNRICSVGIAFKAKIGGNLVFICFIIINCIFFQSVQLELRLFVSTRTKLDSHVFGYLKFLK